jgi:hypothetical protein
MPMGIVSDSIFDKELDKTVSTPLKEKNLTVTRSFKLPPTFKDVEKDLNDGGIVKPEKESKTKGRQNGDVNIPNGLRNLVGQTAVTESREEALALAKSFGISPSSVSAYTQGATSTKSYHDTPNVSVINNAKERVSKRARNKLMLALSKITEDKLDVSKARDLASVAKDMSAIMKNMEADSSVPTEKSGPTFIFYTPKIRAEENFDVVKAKD